MGILCQVFSLYKMVIAARKYAILFAKHSIISIALILLFFFIGMIVAFVEHAKLRLILYIILFIFFKSLMMFWVVIIIKKMYTFIKLVN